MFETSTEGAPAASWIGVWLSELSSAALPSDDAGMIDEIRALEELTCKARARQAALSVRFDASQRSQQAARGVPANRQGRGVAEQIAPRPP